MKRISNDPKLTVIEYGETSPLVNHSSMELAVDTENREFFVHEVMLVTYGTDSVINACANYFGGLS